MTRSPTDNTPSAAVPALPDSLEKLPQAPSMLGKVATPLFLLALFLPPFFLGDDEFRMNLFTKYIALGIFALGTDLVWGYTGLLSLGQGLYFGLGAYSIGYSLKLQKTAEVAGAPPGTVLLPDFMEYCRMSSVPVWIAPLIDIWTAFAVAIGLPTLVAFLFGLAIFRLRIKGVYFSIITQALVLAISILVMNQQPYTGGVVGMTYLAKLQLFGYTFQHSWELYFLIASVLVFCYLGCAFLVRSKFGKILTAIRDNENRVLFLGYNTAMYKVFVFALAGALSGLSGALYVCANRSTGPEYLSIAFSIEAVILVAVGGKGTLVGAILGTLLVRLGNTHINEEFPRYWPIILGMLFIAVVMFLPDGLVGWLGRMRTRLESKWTSGKTTLVS